MKKTLLGIFIFLLFLVSLFTANLRAQQMEADAAAVHRTVNPPGSAEAPPYLPQPYYTVPHTTYIIRESDPANLSRLLMEAAEKTGTLAKNMGSNLGDYVKDKKLEKKQSELVENFYRSFEEEVSRYRLSMPEYTELRHGVEQIYIADGQTGRYQLDPVYFRQMPVIVKKVLADIRLPKIQNGPATTYYLNGFIYQQWNLKDARPHGSVVTYYEDSGEIQFIDIYEEGRRLLRRKYDADGQLLFEQKYDYSLSGALSPEA